jgi:DNA-binding transcriptional MerR regulator
VSQLADEGQFEEVERRHPQGMSVQQIVEELSAQGEKLTEATFRKYVQLGLLPRSVRVGKKGKHRGSQGLYPATAVRQVLLIRRLMQQGFTIDEIQSRFLFVRGEIDALATQLERVLTQLAGAHGADDLSRREVEEARKLGASLLDKVRDVERRMAVRARMERAAV